MWLFTSPKQMKYKKIALTLALTALAPLAFAAQPKAKEQVVPAPIQSIATAGVKVVKSFPAEGGLTGWVLTKGPNQHMIVFTPPSGEVVIAGTVIDSKGKNLTNEYLSKHVPQPEYSKLWNKLEANPGTWVAEGAQKEPKSVLYVFKDPNCGYCHLAWKALQPYEKAGLQVRWIPVAFLGGDSLDKAANLLDAKNGDEAVEQLHQKWGTKTTVVTGSKEAKATVQSNNGLMAEWGFQGTPAVIYKDKSGAVKAAPGMFRLSDIPAMTGLPDLTAEVLAAEPSLSKFK